METNKGVPMLRWSVMYTLFAVGLMVGLLGGAAYTGLLERPVKAQGSRTTSIQAVPVVSEAMTVAASSTAFAGGTTSAISKALTGIRTGGVVCIGTVETGAIRFTVDGTTPSATVGHPVPADTQIRIDGWTTVQAWRGFRQGGTSGAIFWTCYV